MTKKTSPSSLARDELSGESIFRVAVSSFRTSSKAWAGSFIHATAMLLCLLIASIGWGIWTNRPAFGVTCGLFSLLSMGARGVLRTRMVPDVTSHLTSIAVATAFGIAGGVIAATVVNAQTPELGSIVALAFVQCGAAVLALMVSGAVLRSIWLRGRLRSKALVLGTGRLAEEFALELAVRPNYGVDIVGFVSSTSPGSGASSGDFSRDSAAWPIFEGLDDLAAAVASSGADRLVVTPFERPIPELVDALRWANGVGLPVFVVPRFYELGLGLDSMSPDRIRGFPLVRLQPSAHPKITLVLKRVIDVVASFIAIVLLLPALVGTALAVKLTTRGPILFRQERLGRNGQTIVINKFRSMTVSDIEHQGWTDPSRVTPIGRLMRATAIDELPQLFNVLVGDMSLVGPRPERLEFAKKFAQELPGYADRHRMPVGLTGLAQVVGLRGDTSIEERVKYDNLYIDQWTLSGDLQIMLKTAWALVRQRHATESHDLVKEQLGKSNGRGGRITESSNVTIDLRTNPGRLTVLHIYEPDNGGVPHYVADLAVEQMRAGLDVHVAGPLDFATGASTIAASLDRRTPVSLRRYARHLSQVIDSVGPDVVHAHSYFAGLAVAFDKRHSAKTVYQPHAWSFNRSGPASILALASERWAIRRHQHVLVLSKGERREAIAAGLRGEFHMVGSAVDTERFRPDVDRAHDDLHDLGVPSPFVLCLGRVSQQKQQLELADAWAASPLSESTWKLVIVGPATHESRHRLAALEPKGVLYRGSTDEPERWLRAADLVIQPSAWEGLSLVTLEALASGTPVVATDVAGMIDSIGIGDQSAGAVVPDIPALLRAVMQRQSDPALLAVEASRARDRVLRHFSWGQVEQRIFESYCVALRRDPGVRAPAAVEEPTEVGTEQRPWA